MTNECAATTLPMRNLLHRNQELLITRAASLLAVFAVLVCALTAGAQTTNNDSSCDISVTPAATLLLPYFEVDFTAPAAQARTTLFTVTNTSAYPQIARATIWTDWGYPILTFDLFLTGYDVTGVNLYDLLAHGRLPSRNIPAPGAHSAPNYSNLNHATTAVPDCASRPDSITTAALSDIRAALTTGLPSGPAACVNSRGARVGVGSNHGTTAVGYVTIDVVATCSAAAPGNADYFKSDLLYDNVLLGDWMAITPSTSLGNYAAGSPLVHIRAIPEGGPAGTVVPAALPYTFYDGYTPAASAGSDRRQPLPSIFNVRYIQGGFADFQTRITIWREGAIGANAPCAAYGQNSRLPIPDVVRFDEHENATMRGNAIQVLPLPGEPGLPVSSATSSASSIFPTLVSPQGDIAGWMYLNLGGSRRGTPPPAGDAGGRQAWVVASMYAEGRYAQAFDAVALSNGCSPAPAPGGRIGGQ